MNELLKQQRDERKGRETKFSQNDELNSEARPRVSVHLGLTDAYSLPAAELASHARTVSPSPRATSTPLRFYLKRDGKWHKRYVLSTRALKAGTITWWGKRRWQIEGWFKTAKHRFGLHCFGQQTLRGMYRWLILSLTADVLAH
jgi:hypothetical protein